MQDGRQQHSPSRPFRTEQGEADQAGAGSDVVMDDFTPTIVADSRAPRLLSGARRGGPARATASPSSSVPHAHGGGADAAHGLPGNADDRHLSTPVPPPAGAAITPTSAAATEATRERAQNAAVSFREASRSVPSAVAASPGAASRSPRRRADPSIAGVSAGRPSSPAREGGGRFNSRRHSIVSQNSSLGFASDFIDRASRVKLGPLQLSRLVHNACQPAFTGDANDASGFPAGSNPPVRLPTDSALPRSQGNPQAEPQGAPRTAAAAVVHETAYYGCRGKTLAEQAEAEEEDEERPRGFDRVAVHGGDQRVNLASPSVSTALVMLVPLIFLLVSSAFLFSRTTVKPSLRAALDLSRILDSSVVSLSSEQAAASRMSVLSNLQGILPGPEQKTFFAMWDKALLRYTQKHADSDRYYSDATALINEHEGGLQLLLGGLTPRAFLDISYLYWTRVQCTTNKDNTDVMGFYDDVSDQLVLFNGALSVAAFFNIESDRQELRTLFSVAMHSLARVSRLFLKVKSDQYPGNVDDFALPSSVNEYQFIVRALAAMHVAELTLRFASDHMAAWEYALDEAAGSGIADISTIPSLKFVNMRSPLHFIGFSSETQAGLMEMLQRTFDGKPYDAFNVTTSDALYDDSRKLTKLALSNLADQTSAMKRALSSPQRARTVCLLVLMSVCAAGIIFHVLMIGNAFVTVEQIEALNQYARQLQGSLQRMHSASLKMARLQLGDVDAEVKLSLRPKLRTITAEERELYLGVGMLLQLEPYLPLPVRYPPRDTPASALVNTSLFLKPALVAREGLVGIRVDFTRMRGYPRDKGGSQRDRHSDTFTLLRQPNNAMGETAPSLLSSVRDREGSSMGASWANSILGADGFRARTGRGGLDASTHAKGNGELSHYVYKTEILRVLGALANARPEFATGDGASRDRNPGATACHTRSGRAFMQSAGDVTMVWLNVCDDVSFANLLAMYICTVLMRYCADGAKPCPELTVCCGDGVVGNVSSYAAEKGDAPHRGKASAARRPQRPPYEALWAKSAFFARAGADSSAAGQSTTVPVKQLQSGTGEAAALGAVMGTVVSSGRGDLASADADLLLVATAELSKRARALLWVRQLLGMPVRMGVAAGGVLADRRFTQPASPTPTQHPRRGSRAAGSSFGRETGNARGRTTSLLNVLSSSSRRGEIDAESEKVRLPLALPPKFAPKPEAACLTSVVVYGAVVNELERLHALAEVHQQPVLANDAVVEGMLRESLEFNERYDASRDGSTSSSRRRGARADLDGPMVTLAGRNRTTCTVDLERFMAGLRAFTPTLVPVDLVERSREYVPVVGEHPDAAAPAGPDQRRKKTGKNKRREAEPVSRAKEANRAAQQSRTPVEGGWADAETDLQEAFPAPARTAPDGALPSYRRQITGRSPISLPGYAQPCVPLQSVDSSGRPLFVTTCELRAVYTWVGPLAEDRAEGAQKILSAWLRVFNAYARLSYAVSAVEPSRFPLRGDQERKQLMGMAAEVSSAVTDLQTDFFPHGDAAQLAMLGDASASRPVDLAKSVEDFAANGPLTQSTGGHASDAVGRYESRFFPHSFLSSQVVDTMRFFRDANI